MRRALHEKVLTIVKEIEFFFILPVRIETTAYLTMTRQLLTLSKHFEARLLEITKVC